MKLTKKQAEHMKWLKFAILLSQVDFAELTAGQRLDLKNDFQRFLRSMDSPGEAHEVLRELQDVAKAPELVTAILKQEAIDENEAQEVLKKELAFIVSEKTFIKIPQKPEVVVPAITCFRDTFDFVTFPRSRGGQIFALLGEHLRGAGISRSMLTRCPECQKIFIASRKPRLDRKFHCSPACSSNAASKAYRERKKLKRAKKLIATGRSVKKAAEIVKADLAWLESKLKHA